jgi:hypothetical protein
LQPSLQHSFFKVIIALTLILMIFLSNLPWITQDFLIFIKLKKTLLVIFIEILLYFFVFRLVTFLLELSIFGNVHDQGWQFYAALLALFIVSSSPGFVVKVLWK